MAGAADLGRIKIYGSCVSGNCLKVRWVADKLGVAYDWVEIDIARGDTRTEEFLAINPAGQVPCVVFEDGSTLAQSNAIILYLAEIIGSDLIPADAFARAQMMSWLFWEQYSHEPAIAVRRFQKHILGKPDDEIDPTLLGKGRRALGVMELNFTHAEWLVGAGMTLADVALVAYTRVAHEGGFDLSEFPGVTAWIRRVERALGIPTALEAA